MKTKLRKTTSKALKKKAECRKRCKVDNTIPSADSSSHKIQRIEVPVFSATQNLMEELSYYFEFVA